MGDGLARVVLMDAVFLHTIKQAQYTHGCFIDHFQECIHKPLNHCIGFLCV